MKQFEFYVSEYQSYQSMRQRLNYLQRQSEATSMGIISHYTTHFDT